MALNILFAGRADQWGDYEPALKDALTAAGIEAHVSPDHSPGTVDYLVYAPNGPVQDFTPFTRARAVLNLWAGVDTIVKNPTLTIPLTRMVDEGLARGMTEWVTAHVLRYHLGIDRDILNADATWDPRVPPLAKDRSVVILGLGTLGQSCAEALVALGFHVIGWSRSPKEVDGVRCLDGEAGLAEALSSAEIVVLLLPDTPETQDTLDAEALARLPRGAFVINPGRGPLIDDEALLAALDSGQVAHATLDVFRVEPLPKDHPYWAHPNVTVTPHIAADTRASTAAEVIAENIRRNEAGEKMLYLVDRSAGY